MPQHYLPKFGFSFWEGGTLDIFGVPQHHPPKFGLSFQKGETLGIFGVCSIILQNLGFLLGWEGLPIFFFHCLFTFLHSLFSQNKRTICTSFSCNILMSHTFFTTLLPILQLKHNMTVLSLFFFPIQQSNSVIWLQQIAIMYTKDFAFLYFIVISVTNIHHAGLIQGHSPPVAVLGLGLDHPYRGGWNAHRCEWCCWFGFVRQSFHYCWWVWG